MTPVYIAQEFSSRRYGFRLVVALFHLYTQKTRFWIQQNFEWSSEEVTLAGEVVTKLRLKTQKRERKSYDKQKGCNRRE
jgi:hypothetical protein